MNTMTHQGYTARIEFDERDNIFIGRVLGLRSIISFHGETVKQLRSELKSAVEDYLADCEEQGLAPEKPASGKLLLRVPPEIHSRALVKAQASGKSLNQWATEALEHQCKLRADRLTAAREAAYRQHPPTKEPMRVDLVSRGQHESLVDLLCELHAFYTEGVHASRELVRSHLLRHLLAADSRFACSSRPAQLYVRSSDRSSSN